MEGETMMTATGVAKVRIEIGGSYVSDECTMVYELTPEQADVYQTAQFAFERARTARDKALGAPIRFPKGVCNFWLLNVRLTADGNQFIKAGTTGDMNVIECSHDRRVLKALFHPTGSPGFGEVTWPQYEKIG
jgi:hypothetical protein